MVIAGVFLFCSFGKPILVKFVIVYLSDMWNHLNIVALPVASMMTSKSILSSQIVAWLSLVMGRPFVYLVLSLCFQRPTRTRSELGLTISSLLLAFYGHLNDGSATVMSLLGGRIKFWKIKFPATCFIFYGDGLQLSTMHKNDLRTRRISNHDPSYLYLAAPFSRWS